MCKFRIFALVQWLWYTVSLYHWNPNNKDCANKDKWIVLTLFCCLCEQLCMFDSCLPSTKLPLGFIKLYCVVLYCIISILSASFIWYTQTTFWAWCNLPRSDGCVEILLCNKALQGGRRWSFLPTPLQRKATPSGRDLTVNQALAICPDFNVD